jgi:hypothetical protein
MFTLSKIFWIYLLISYGREDKLRRELNNTADNTTLRYFKTDQAAHS